MTARMVYLAMALASGIAFLPQAPALADNNWKQSSAVWRIMDKCTRIAQKQYPDHTPDGIAKREAVRRQCLRASNLPGDDAPAPQPTGDQR